MLSRPSCLIQVVMMMMRCRLRVVVGFERDTESTKIVDEGASRRTVLLRLMNDELRGCCWMSMARSVHPRCQRLAAATMSFDG